MTHEEIDYEAREAMQALRGKLSKRATSAEFNEWMAREVCEYIDHLLQAQTWRPIDTAPADGTLILAYDKRDKPEFAIDLRKSDGDFWRLYECGPTHWMPLPLPPSSFEERASATPSDQQSEEDA
jgi:hypothetical protein